jgi:hypothetical protein
LGCGTADLPLKYLGLPLGVSFKLKAIWRDLEDLMAWRLAPWKHSYLSKGGRVALIKSTLSNLPTDTVCSPILEGGLGIQNVRKFN